MVCTGEKGSRNVLEEAQMLDREEEDLHQLLQVYSEK